MKANFKREVKRNKNKHNIRRERGKTGPFCPGWQIHPGLKVGRGLGIFPARPKTPFVSGGATTRDKRPFCPGWWLHPGQNVFLGGPGKFPARGTPLVPGGSTTRDKRTFCPGSWLHPGQKGFLGGLGKFPARGPPLVPCGSTTRDKRVRFPSFPPNLMFVFVSFYFSFKIGFHLLIQ